MATAATSATTSCSATRPGHRDRRPPGGVRPRRPRGLLGRPLLRPDADLGRPQGASARPRRSRSTTSSPSPRPGGPAPRRGPAARASLVRQRPVRPGRRPTGRQRRQGDGRPRGVAPAEALASARTPCSGSPVKSRWSLPSDRSARRALRGDARLLLSGNAESRRSDLRLVVCAPGRIRTCGTWYRKPVLYPLSYGGMRRGDVPRAARHPTAASGRLQSGRRPGGVAPRYRCEARTGAPIPLAGDSRAALHRDRRRPDDACPTRVRSPSRTASRRR